MVVSVQISNVQFDSAFYKPNQPVHLTVSLQCQVEHPLATKLTAQVFYLDQSIGQVGQPVTLENGRQDVKLSIQPPPDSPRGYGVDLSLHTADGGLLAETHTAFDVLERWTQSPRYGFLTGFEPGRTDAAATMAGLNRYHLNALQFYDWMYRHDQFFTDQDPYRDPMGRTLSLVTVKALIDAAHQYGIAAMPYTAVYAATIPFYEQHPGWALFGPDGKPIFFGDNFLVYMDPRPDSPWTQHLMDQFAQILQKTKFDGIHLDQYGDPKVGYDAQGNAYQLDTVLAQFIDLTHKVVDKERPGGAVIFNAVTNWPVETVAPSSEDIVYIEVWPPYTWFDSLHQLIAQAQGLGGGKAVVLAAYIDPFLEHNVRLMDAVIFASGGGHIELGEHDDMLADAYFPRYGQMSAALAETMRRYYDFAIRYENVIGASAKDASQAYYDRLAIPGVVTQANIPNDKVMTIVRETEATTAVNLVNLLGVKSPEWKAPIASDPKALGEFTLQLSGVTRPVKAVWLASPDAADPGLQSLDFSAGDGQLTVQIPGLAYWDMVLIDWGD
jgi:dextranase